jgi:flagellar hook-associated protein 1 FlgK
MAGLFDTLALGSRSLETYRKAIDVTGHNLANVNTPGYTRQRLVLESVAGSSDIGEIGGGVDATQVQQLHNQFFDQQIQVESSVQGSLEARQDALQQALTSLQETINRSDPSGTSTSGISQALSDFFGGLQSLSTDPGSIPERQVFLQKAQTLAARFNQVDSKLGNVSTMLNESISSDVNKVNTLAQDIAKLNGAIAQEEAASGNPANDLRDSRQSKVQELARLVKVDVIEQPPGSLNLIVGGVPLVAGGDVVSNLETFDSGNGDLQVRAGGQVTALSLTGGSIEGSISVRDKELSQVRAQINTLAETLVSEMNTAHAEGFGMAGSTGAAFFTGQNAKDIAVNSALLADPAFLQANGVSGETGDNAVVVAMARLGNAAHAALNGQSFSDRQAQIVAGLGQNVADAQRDVDDQKAISDFVESQRESISGVSLDEEMANLVMFQKAFQASAKLISMTDEMLATIIQM